jgi:gas vesicle protein
MKSFLVGFSFGFAAGLLFAPMKGAEARVMAGIKASEIADKVQETYQHVKDTVGKTVESVRGEGSSTGTGTRG